MQIKAAITENLIFINILVIIQGIKIILVASSSQEEVDVAFETTVSAVTAESPRVWNSIEFYDLYQSNGGRDISRRTLVTKLLEYFGSDLLVLSGIGVASLLVFRSKASSLLRLVPSSDEDDVEIELKKVAHQIVRDVNE